jgi:hypothetical protein
MGVTLSHRRGWWFYKYREKEIMLQASDGRLSFGLTE